MVLPFGRWRGFESIMGAGVDASGKVLPAFASTTAVFSLPRFVGTKPLEMVGVSSISNVSCDLPGRFLMGDA